MGAEMSRIDEFWQKFLQDTGRGPDTRPFECFHFELSERLANALLELVLSGKKRATASSLKSFESEGSPPPKPGDLSVVTDWDGTPRCVIETTAVAVLPFRDITFEICSREGEDDNLESWRRGHRRFFTEEEKELGYTFDEDMLVVFEDFRVIYQI
jgi:uncharacterized protein YhfF